MNESYDAKLKFGPVLLGGSKKIIPKNYPGFSPKQNNFVIIILIGINVCSNDRYQLVASYEEMFTIASSSRFSEIKSTWPFVIVPVPWYSGILNLNLKNPMFYCHGELVRGYFSIQLMSSPQIVEAELESVAMPGPGPGPGAGPGVASERQLELELETAPGPGGHVSESDYPSAALGTGIFESAFKSASMLVSISHIESFAATGKFHSGCEIAQMREDVQFTSASARVDDSGTYLIGCRVLSESGVTAYDAPVHSVELKAEPDPRAIEPVPTATVKSAIVDARLSARSCKIPPHCSSFK